MFTGIIEEKAKVKRIEPKKNLYVIKVSAGKVSKGMRVGDSIAVNGVCLTITEKAKQILSFDIMKETISRTTFKNLRPNDTVNLERALKMNSRLSGHFVTGHIDGVGIIKRKITKPNYIELHIKAPKHLLKYFATKGSVSLDGVSLTVGEVNNDYFSVYLIPHTIKFTTLGSLKANDKVNIETDILAKYVQN